VQKRKSTQKPRDTSTPAGATTSESVRSMVKKGNRFSKRINYDAIEGLFGSSTINGSSNKVEKLWSFDKDRDSSVDVEDGRPHKPSHVHTRSRTPGQAECPYDERHEEEDKGEMVQVLEDEGGGVGFAMRKQYEQTHNATLQQLDEAAEYEGDDTLAEDDPRYEDYNYYEAYEQEV
jgi:transcription factor IIIB 90 kDa subunit